MEIPMVWTMLRCGWGNTATICALGLLPLTVIAGFGREPGRPASLQAEAYSNPAIYDTADRHLVIASTD
jgi:hypothetical protein